MSTPQINVQERVTQIRREQALQGDTDNHKTFQAAAKRAQDALNDFEQAEQELRESGQLTEDGVKAALAHPYETQKKVLASLTEQVVDARVANINTGLNALPKPTVTELSEMERHRIVEAFTGGPDHQRRQMLIDAHTNQNLAAALSAEEGAVTGFPDSIRERLSAVATDDPASDKRAVLNGQLAAAESLRQTINDIDEKMKRRML